MENELRETYKRRRKETIAATFRETITRTPLEGSSRNKKPAIEREKLAMKRGALSVLQKAIFWGKVQSEN